MGLLFASALDARSTALPGGLRAATDLEAEGGALAVLAVLRVVS